MSDDKKKRARTVMTAADWERVTRATREAERAPDDVQLALDIAVPTPRPEDHS